MPMPKLYWKPSPNFSSRTAKIDLLVIHDCQGGYEGSIATFATAHSPNPVSAHLVLKEDGSEATQMVSFDKKAWHAVAFNSRSIGLEMAGFEGGTIKSAPKDTYSDAEWTAAERITAYLCKKFGIPPKWAQNGEGSGICRHLDLGRAGGGHTDPTRDQHTWDTFIQRVAALLKSGGIPDDWSPVGAIQPRRKAGYGWIPDLPRMKTTFGIARPAALKNHYDLRAGFGPCYDQGQTSSCTGNATAALFEYIRKAEGHFDWMPSRLFPYWCGRAMESDTFEDGGAQIHDVVASVVKYGIPPERLWPFDLNAITTRPSEAAWNEAIKFHAVAHESVPQNIDAFKTAFEANVPIEFGFTVYESFESDAVARTGIVPIPGPNEKAVGGHAVVMVGLDDASRMAIVRNSWGTDWGEDGYFMYPYPLLLNAQMSSDFQLVRKTIA